MGRPKGSTKKTAEVAQETVHGTETEQVSIAPAIEPGKPEIVINETPPALTFPYDSWVYSETDPPMILKAGSPMPKGYADRKSIKQVWVCDANGKFTKG